MSYIRSGSNPEGLYIFSTQGPKGRLHVEVLVGWFHKLTNITNDSPMLVPQGVFDRAAVMWDDDGEKASYKGFKVEEVHVYEDDGSPVPKKRSIKASLEDKRRSFFGVKVSYKGKWVIVWRVTWAYVVRNVLGRFAPVKKSRKGAKVRVK